MEKIKCLRCGKECYAKKCDICDAIDWQCECGFGSGHIHSKEIDKELTNEEWKEICKKADAYDNLKTKCERQAEYIERNQNKAKRCGQQQILMQHAVSRLRQNNKDLMSIIRTQKRELANKGRDIGTRNNQIVQLEKQLKDQRHQICEKIREKTKYFDDKWKIIEVLDQIEKGENNE